MFTHCYVGGDHYGYVKRVEDGKIIFGGLKADCLAVLAEIGEGLPAAEEQPAKEKKPRKKKVVPGPTPNPDAVPQG